MYTDDESSAMSEEDDEALKRDSFAGLIMGIRQKVGKKIEKEAAPPALPPHGDEDSLDDDDLHRDTSQVMSLPANLNEGGLGGPYHQSQSSLDTDRILQRANADVISEDSK